MTEIHDERLRSRLETLRSGNGSGDWPDVLRRVRAHHRRRVFGAAVAVALLAAGGASAYVLTRGAPTIGIGTAPKSETNQAAQAPVSAAWRERFKSLLDQIGNGALAYAPTRAPAHYSQSGGGISTGRLDLILTDERYRFTNPAQHSLSFRAAYWPGTLAACMTGATDTLREGASDVAWNGTTAWRCLTLPSGRVVKLSVAAGTSIEPKQERASVGTFTETQLVDVVASAAPF